MAYEDLIARLENFSPPDRTVDEQRPASQAIFDAAAALREQAQEIRLLQKAHYDCRDKSEVYQAAIAALRKALEQITKIVPLSSSYPECYYHIQKVVATTLEPK